MNAANGDQVTPTSDLPVLSRKAEKEKKIGDKWYRTSTSAQPAQCASHEALPAFTIYHTLTV